MPLSYILSQIGVKMGLDPSIEQQRNVMLRFVNEAADELYSEADMVGCLVEQVFKVNGNQTVSLPMYVGKIRAVREFYSQNPVHLTQMKPRYTMFNWKDGWYNYRIKNTQATQADITNSAPLTYSIAALDATPVSVTISGPTDTAQMASETILMDALTKQGTVNFIDIKSATKNGDTNSDVTISDADGNVITTIGNNRREAKFQILDISEAPWSPVSNSGVENYVEILYKEPLAWLSKDSDEFPAAGYDNQLVNKALQLYFEEQEKPDIALLYDAKATRGMARKRDDENRATEDTVSFLAHQHDTIQPRIRGSRFTRWTGWRRR